MTPPPPRALPVHSVPQLPGVCPAPPGAFSGTAQGTTPNATHGTTAPLMAPPPGHSGAGKEVHAYG